MIFLDLLYKISLIVERSTTAISNSSESRKKIRYIYNDICTIFKIHTRIIRYSRVYSIFFFQISTRALPFSRSSRLLIRLPHFQIFHLPSRALRGSREKYLATSRDGLYGISASGIEFLLFRGIIRKKSRWRACTGFIPAAVADRKRECVISVGRHRQEKKRSEKKKVDPMQSDSRRKILTSADLIHVDTLKTNVRRLFLNRASSTIRDN